MIHKQPKTKRDYKDGHDDNKRYSHDRDNRDGHDDNQRYSHDRDNRDGHEDKFSKDRDDRHDDGKSSVKYIKCNNVNINGKEKERNSHDGNSPWSRDGGSEWSGQGGGSEWSGQGGGSDWSGQGGGSDWSGQGGGSDWSGIGGGNDNGQEMAVANGFTDKAAMDNHNFPGFIKQTDKDVVVICIFNNDDRDKKENKTKNSRGKM